MINLKYIYVKNLKILRNLKHFKKDEWGLGIGDWGLGIGDWPNPQSPIPNPLNLKEFKL